MSNPYSPTLDEVVEKIMEDDQRERVEQSKNQETVLAEEMREEIKEVEGELGGERVFLSDKGVEVLSKNLAKKRFIEERGFNKLVLPFKEEMEIRGWEAVCQHLEPG